jgi:hypothetical protein
MSPPRGQILSPGRSEGEQQDKPEEVHGLRARRDAA